MDIRRRLLNRKTIIIVIVVALVTWLFIRRQSQRSDDAVTGEADRASIPTMVTYDSNIVHTDSGYPRYRATSRLYYSFDNAPEPYWLFPEGAFIEQLDNDRNIVATLQADSAVYNQNRQIWDCVGNVRIHNINGDKLLTNQLFYDVRSQKIYSDSFIHIEKSDRIIEGFGFTSNAAITDYVVNRPTMILPVSDFNRQRSDSVPVQAPQPAPPSKPKKATGPKNVSADDVTVTTVSFADHPSNEE